ncbi:D-alanyl-D-alanine carboxypeptidase/D-alanyl-D-alanine endopeptidase [Dysgonomonas macrotermitis]|uniref:D-alanyl-D-alanine carboxypeptidase / D-alanyl-D-alanine-endopeptidase (Penicillin-binding protein 4) n=1 Tax=Dysgonomonas macrotermitis TaxID=1346286 RepID=A0A1M4SXT6_9BACT|nr:D-alanyl-D-alanine carboxypeptidase/D-alanyl-D-alanine-endopeptidase [Dysgonomonas macrotermitis]SHE37031.1 D-alanyl-D-alanine carboxypeptidase / D-alanyl-D-alanine-endopeptidase (penicillin-binding protein 4) [Dysgonomonas macrotermitis]
MRYILLVLFTGIFSITGFAQNTAAINTFVNTQGFENALLGFCVKDLNGKEVASYNKDAALTPASTLKIVTTATALEVLGDNYSFPTTLSLDAGNPQRLIIHGYGDPTLGSEHIGRGANDWLNDWIIQIKKKTGSDLPIDIYIDDSYFGYTGVSSKWLQEDLGNYFAAGTYGISIYDNLYRLYFNTESFDEAPRIVKTQPDMPELIFLNTLKTNSSSQDNGYINGQPFSNYRTLVGDIPANRKSFSIKGDIPDPGLMLGNILSQRLSEEGYTIGNISTARTQYFEQMYNTFRLAYNNENLFYTHLSPDLKLIIRVINEKSNNHYTEHLMRTIGRTLGNKDSYTNPLPEGITQTGLFWQSKGIDTNSMHIYDGCGLAPSNAISAQMLCDILVYMKTQSKYSESFYESLPKAGKEGTVRNVLKGTRLEGKVVMKSGSIANVQCFAGYYIDGNKKYAFSVMVNNYNSPRRQTVKAIETLLLNTF